MNRAKALRARLATLASAYRRLSEIIDFGPVERIPTSVSQTRIIVFGSFLALAFSAFIIRYAWLSVAPSAIRSELQGKDIRQHSSQTRLSTHRAAILDRSGRPLALTVMKPSVFITPLRLTDTATIKRLASISRIAEARISKWKDEKRQFVWLERQTTQERVSKYTALDGWEGFGGVLSEPARVYPQGSLAAQVIGFTGIDNQGLAGIELVYEQELAGETQLVNVTRDARRRLAVTFPNEASQPKASKDPLVLSIDLEAQRIMERELSEAAQQTEAAGASGIVLDIRTGEIFALASVPSFDLNHPESKTPASARNRPVQDAMELGSVIKPIVVAAALNEGVIKPNEEIDCEGGALRLPGSTIHDTKPNKILSIGDILRKSSNVCMYKIAARLGRQKLAAYLSRAGLVHPPGTGLPGEYTGQSLDPDKWVEVRFANIAFGQGIAISPLQLARAMATTVGSGVRLPLHILKVDEAGPGGPTDNDGTNTTLHPSFPAFPQQRVFAPEVSQTIRGMMMAIVDGVEPTAQLAQLAMHSAGGKTGTAEKFSTTTHTYSERTPNFIGFFPAEHPKFLIYIVLDEVKVRPAWGGKWAAPVFAHVGDKLAQYLKAKGHLDLYSSKGTRAK
jgi:cell division protein FtsI (penicillin-binding protein 3)